MLFFVLLAILSLSSLTKAGVQDLFPEERREYNYIIKSNVSSGILAPSTADSYWTLDGKLIVQVLDNHTRVRFKLEDLRTAVNSRNLGYSSYQSADAANLLKMAWEVEYQERSIIRCLYMNPLDSAWSRNIKRALSVNFQLYKSSGTYSSGEPCMDGVCHTVYTATGNIIRKFVSGKASIVNARSWSSVPLMLIDSDIFEPSTISTAERIYELDDRKGLVSMELKGDFEHKTFDHILSVSSELSLYYDTDAPLTKIKKLNLTTASLQYEDKNFADPSNGIKNCSQKFLKNATYELLLKIARTGVDADNVVGNASVIHNLDFVKLLNLMTQLEYISLSKLFKDMALGTSYEVETSRNIFLEVLPHVRSNACALFVKYLVTKQKKKIEDATLLSLIRKLPFNIANYSQELIEELEVLTNLGLEFPREIRHAGILTYAILVSKTMEAWKMKQDYFDNIVVKYFRMYNDCPQYIDRMAWLQGLCNMGHLSESYTKTIYSDKTRERHERLWAGLEAHKTVRSDSVMETALPILLDDTEHTQLRISALNSLLSCDIRATDFIFLHNYIKNCDNNQLKKFWYATVKALEGNKEFSEYRTASYFVPFISNQVSNPDSTYWATNNYIVTTDSQPRASMQIMSVGEPLSAVPAMAAVKISTGGVMPQKVSLYIIAEGVTTNLYKKFHTFNSQDLKVDRLLEIMKIMKVQIVEPEKIHIDIILKVQDKTVFVGHVNQTKFESWNGEDLTKSIEEFLRFGSHINQQFAYYPLQSDVMVPTELGTPIRLQSTILAFSSLRGNLTAPSRNDLTWKNDLHIRYQGTSVTSLTTYAPLLQSEHTSLLQHSLVAHLPVNVDVTLSPVNKSLSLKWPNPRYQHGGIAIHSRTQISMESPKGKDAYTVVPYGKEKMVDNDSIQMFDCTRPVSLLEIVEQILSKRNALFKILTHPSEIILDGLLHVISPTPERCGLLISLTPPLEDVKEGLLELDFVLEELEIRSNDRIKVKVNHSLTYGENQHDGEMYLKAEGHTKVESSEGNMTFEFALRTNDWKMCLQQEDIVHAAFDQDILSHPAAYEGHLAYSYGKGDQSDSCPATGTQLLVQYKGVPTDDYGTLERYFEVEMLGEKLSELHMLAKLIGDEMVLGHLLSEFGVEDLNVTTVIREKNGVASVVVNHNSWYQVKSDNFAWLLDSWTNMQLMKKFGIYRECRLQESTVQTLSGSTDQLPPVQCMESLALADCTSSPRFAVFRLKSGGVKLYLGGHVVTIAKLGNGVKINLNGITECGNEQCVIGDEEIQDFIITRTGDSVKIHSSTTGVQLYYRQNETVIQIPHSYMATSCGECTGQHYYNLCQ